MRSHGLSPPRRWAIGLALAVATAVAAVVVIVVVVGGSPTGDSDARGPVTVTVDVRHPGRPAPVAVGGALGARAPRPGGDGCGGRGPAPGLPGRDRAAQGGRRLVLTGQVCKPTLALLRPDGRMTAVPVPSTTPASPTRFGALCRQLTGIVWTGNDLLFGWTFTPKVSLEGHSEVGLSGLITSARVP